MAMNYLKKVQAKTSSYIGGGDNNFATTREDADAPVLPPKPHYALQQQQSPVADRQSPSPSPPLPGAPHRPGGPMMLIPDPVITDDMDEETKAIVRKRHQQDKERAEQKAIMKRKLEELEYEQKQEFARREMEDRKRREDFERLLREVDERIKQEQLAAEQEARERERRLHEFKAKEAERLKQFVFQKHRDIDELENNERMQTQRKRAMEDHDSKEKAEQWRRDEEERMRREHLARLKAQEEKEKVELEQLLHQREEEDKATAERRAASRKAEIDKTNEDATNKVKMCEVREAKAAADRATEQDEVQKQLMERRHDVEDKERMELLAIKKERDKKDFEFAELLSKVQREREDIERLEQKERVRRQQEDIERREAKERTRREEDDRRRREQLQRVKKEQEELERIEREERERREREDRERQALREQVGKEISALDTPAPLTSLPSTLSPPSKPLPSAVSLGVKVFPVVAPATATAGHPQPPPMHPQPPQQSASPPPSKKLPSPPPKPVGLEAESHSAEVVSPPRPPKPVPQRGISSTNLTAGKDDFNPAVISPAQQQQYGVFFSKTDLDRDGFISGVEAKPFFKRSTLSNEVLARIWRLSDVDGDNKLNHTEFAIATHLVYGCLRGHELPTTLPTTLRPK
eukprot:TRINITY_DN158_c0_g2_i1.p1 TRINITY_DN158_c0_g2~~TRINITY_DN158_c0_g2_i1.p1  ORF type:complete len:639 (+),score=251.94 TRINITY_DN158_c0_g2_i1:90-2006(+)